MIQQPHIHARVERQCDRSYAVARDGVQQIDREGIGHDEAAEVIFVT